MTNIKGRGMEGREIQNSPPIMSSLFLYWTYDCNVQ